MARKSNSRIARTARPQHSKRVRHQQRIEAVLNT